MKRFIRTRDTVVTDAIEGLLAGSDGRGLTRLDGFPDLRVVLRADWNGDRVALVSGGGSGHEPAHAGYVGEGMLTAAVCGAPFASPSVDAVLAAIRAVTGPAGCLLIVKNYTGDRLNFGLAAELARGAGLKVEMVIVGDDVALPDNPQPRGIAGTLFVHKLAGAHAASGAPLADVAATARALGSATAALGRSRTRCHPIGTDLADRIGPQQLELGLGIHGEPGVETRPLEPVDALVDLVAARLLDAVRPRPEDRFALMVNDLGTSGPLEMNIVMRAVARSALAPHVSHLVGPAPLMTALDMHGFSLSLLRLDPQRTRLLEAPAAPRAWPPAAPMRGEVVPVPLPAGLVRSAVPASSDPVLRSILSTIARTLQDNERSMDELDAKVGDGDAGSTFALAGRSVAAELDTLPLADGAALMRAIADLLMRSAGGSSGVLMATMAAAASIEFAQSQNWARAFAAGVERLRQNGGARPGDRTMLDALQPAADSLLAGGSLSDAARAARAGADATAAMSHAGAGRSSYLGARNLTGIPDPGAEMVARVFEAVAGRG